MAVSPRSAKKNKRPRTSLSPRSSSKRRTPIVVPDSDSESEWKTDAETEHNPQSKTRSSQAPPQNSSGTKTSWVWKYFVVKQIGGVDRAVCQAKKPGSNDLCLYPLARDKSSSTKSMIRHLDRIHKISADVVAQESAIDMYKYVKEGRVCKVSGVFDALQMRAGSD